MEATKDYQQRVGKSPDKADSWILTHYDKLPKRGALDFSKSEAQGVAY
jgi:hypothetical protein